MKTKRFLSLVACAAVLAGEVVAQTIEVTSTGVGIGTTNPATRLSIVSGEADFTTGLSFGRTVTGTGKYVFTNSDNNVLRLGFAANTGTSHSDYTTRLVMTAVGNVGIGTTTPSAKLEVGPGAADAQTVKIQGSSTASQSYGLLINAGSNATDNSLNVGPFDGSRNDFIVKGNGNVGIGTHNPLAPLQVGDGTDAASMTGVAGFIRATSHLYSTGIAARRDGHAEVGMRSGSLGELGTFTNHSLVLITNAAERMRIDQTGNVGVGTSSPSHKLTVAGSVRATSFVADVNTYADFVFRPGYKLASLGEVEAAIKAKGHLPDIPSEAEVKRDGLDVARMQVKLLQKVEELTLYLLAHEKELQQLRAENQILRSEVSDLKKR